MKKLLSKLFSYLPIINIMLSPANATPALRVLFVCLGMENITVHVIYPTDLDYILTQSEKDAISQRLLKTFYNLKNIQSVQPVEITIWYEQESNNIIAKTPRANAMVLRQIANAISN